MCHLLHIAQLSQDQSYLAIHSCWLLVYFQRDSDSIRDINFHHYEINVHSVKPSIKMALNNKHKILFLYAIQSRLDREMEQERTSLIVFLRSMLDDIKCLTALNIVYGCVV